MATSPPSLPPGRLRRRQVSWRRQLRSAQPAWFWIWKNFKLQAQLATWCGLELSPWCCGLCTETPQGHRRGSWPARPFPLFGVPSSIPHSPTCFPPSSSFSHELASDFTGNAEAAKCEMQNLWFPHTHDIDNTKQHIGHI